MADDDDDDDGRRRRKLPSVDHVTLNEGAVIKKTKERNEMDWIKHMIWHTDQNV